MPLLATFMVENFQPVPNASPDAICRLLEQGSPRRDEWFSMAAGALSHPQCGRYELGQDVVDSVQRVRQGKPRSVLSAVHLARSRHRVMWIEWATPDTEFVGDRVGWLVVETPDETTIGVRFGLLPGSDPVMWGSASILPVMRDAVAPVVVNDDERSLLEETRTTIRDTLTPETVKVKSGSMASRIGLFVPSLALEDIKAQLLLTKGYVGRGGGLVQSRQLTDRGAIDWSPDALDDSAEGIQAATELATTLLLLNWFCQHSRHGLADAT